MRDKKTKFILTVFLVTILSLSVSASVNRGDLCLETPVDQCSGNQLVELGSSDADTDGRDYQFKADVENPDSTGDITLQYKDSFSTSFNDVEDNNYDYIPSPTSSVIVSGVQGSPTKVQTGNTYTLTVNGNELTVGTTFVEDTSDRTATVTVDGVTEYVNVRDTIGPNDLIEIDNIGITYPQFELEDTQSKTVSGETIEVLNVYGEFQSADIYVGGDPEYVKEGDTFNAGGDEIYVETVAPYGNEQGLVRFENREDNNGNGFVEFDKVGLETAPEGYNEYRLMWESDNGNTAYSDSVFFSVDRGNNLPVDQHVTVGSKDVNNPEVTSEVTPNSNINLQVLQQEDDPVNITLVDASDNQAITTIKGNRSEQGTFQTIFSDVTNQILSTFSDTETEGYYSFPTIGDDLMSDQGTQYSFYFEIKERTTPSSTRTTKVYTVETSGTATNPAPVINSVEGYNGSQWVSLDNIGYGELKKIRADITDSNNQYLDVELSYYNEYTGESELEGFVSKGSETGYSTKSGNYYIWDDLVSNNTAPGKYKLNISAYDGAVYTNTSKSYSIDYSSATNVSLNKPFDEKVLQDNKVDFNYSLDGGSGSSKVYLNGSEVYSASYSGNGKKFFNFSETLSKGDYEWDIKYLGDDGSSKTTSAKSFTITSPPSIDSISVINSDAQVGDLIDIDYHFSDDLGLKNYNVTVENPSGSQIASNSEIVLGTSASRQDNELFTLSTDGNFTIQVNLTDADNLHTTRTKKISVESLDQDQTSPISFDNWTLSGFQDQETATIKITADDSTGVGVANISFKKNSQSFQTVEDNSTIVTFSKQQNNSLEYFATDYNGNTESSNIEYVALDKPSSVNPALQISPSAPKTGETVTLNASGSEDTDGSITSFSWDLNGDGVYGDATGAVQSKTFPEDGAYTVSVNVSGSSGFSEVETKTVNIQNRRPNPSFDVSTNNLQIEVDASNSSDPDGSISQYQWDWTNNLQFDDLGGTASHNFSNDGNYNVKLTVTDNDGDTETVIKTVSVSSESSEGSPGTGGGGGGGSGSVDATTVFFNSERSETETYSVPFDETVERELVITNTQRREINVGIDRGSSRTCDIIQVQQSFGSNVYGSGGSYDLSQATESFGSVESSNTSILKIDAPTRSEVQEKGLQNITCSFDTISNYGEAENLEVVVEFNDSLLNRILRFLDSNLFEIPVANMSSADPEVQDRVSVPIWMVVAGFLLLVNVYLYRN